MTLTRERIAELRVDIDKRERRNSFGPPLISYEEYRALLDAAESALWLPIEEAPRDGTWVETWYPGGEIMEAHYKEDEAGDFWWTRARYAISPTHFRPLTPPEDTP